MSVYAVDVEGREDGLYLFRDSEDAESFADAVKDAGGTCLVSEEPVIPHGQEVRELIESEYESR